MTISAKLNLEAVLEADIRVRDASIGIVLTYYCIDLGLKSGVFGSFV